MKTTSWKRSAIVMAAAVGMVLASWSCKSDGGACSGHGGAGGAAAAPEPPRKACDPNGDIAKECPLPPTAYGPSTQFETVTVYYYTDPTCADGFCHYCVSWTETEDPNATMAN
jgi:hypothetical protein